MKKLGLVAVAALAVVALAFAACGDDDDDGGGSADIQAQLDRIEASLAKTQVTAAMNTYRAEALHGLDDEINAASEVEAGWSGPIGRMHQVTVGTTWPEDLQAMADELASALEQADSALQGEDLSALKGAITDAHDAWHELEHDAYAFVGGHEHADAEDHTHAPDDSTDAAEEDTHDAADETMH
jgi:hypothetical protein